MGLLQSVNYVVSGGVSYSQLLLSQSKLIILNITSESDYCNLCTVCINL